MKKAFFIVLIVFMGSACKKYEEGPFLSLRSRTSRICHQWRVEKYVVGDEDLTRIVFPDWQHTLEFTKKGVAQWTNHPYYGNMTGSWNFESDDQNLTMTFDKITDNAKILRLTNSELWLEQYDGNNTVKIQYIRK